MAISPDGTTLATGEDNGTATIREADSSLPQWKFVLDGHMEAVTSVAFAPDSQTLATGGQDNFVKIWRLDSRDEIKVLETGFKNGVRCIAYSPGGKMLAVGGEVAGAGTVKLFDVASWNVGFSLKGHKDVVSSVAFSPDGKLLATGSLDGTVKLWNPANGQESVTIDPHSGQMHSAVFSPDGKLLATGCEDKTVKLWDGATKKQLVTLKGHLGSVDTVAFSPDGKLLASGSSDRTVRLWSISAALAAAKREPKDRIPSQQADTEAQAKVRAMLQERLATLRENAAAKEKLFHDGRIPIQDLDETKLAVLNAELDLAGSDKERIAILEKTVALSKEVESAIDEHFRAGRVTQSVLLDARDKRLKAEIALEQAKAKASSF